MARVTGDSKVTFSRHGVKAVYGLPGSATTSVSCTGCTDRFGPKYFKPSM